MAGRGLICPPRARRRAATAWAVPSTRIPGDDSGQPFGLPEPQAEPVRQVMRTTVRIASHLVPPSSDDAPMWWRRSRWSGTGGHVLEVVMEPTGPAWLPVNVRGKWRCLVWRSRPVAILLAQLTGLRGQPSERCPNVGLRQRARPDCATQFDHFTVIGSADGVSVFVR